MRVSKEELYDVASKLREKNDADYILITHLMIQYISYNYQYKMNLFFQVILTTVGSKERIQPLQ